MAPDTSGREPAAGTPDPAARAAVLVGVDGSLNASRAFDIALGIASSRDLDLELVGAFTYPFSYVDPTDPAVADERAEFRRAVEARIREATDPLVARAADAGVGTRLEIREGDAAGVLMRASEDAVFGVVGKRGRTSFGGRFMGSVSSSFVSHARCPVLVVPEAWTGEPAQAADAPEVEGVAGEPEPAITAELRARSPEVEVPAPAPAEASVAPAAGTSPVPPDLDFAGAIVLAVDPGDTRSDLAQRAADWAEEAGRRLALVSALALGVESSTWVPTRSQRPLLEAPRVRGAAVGRLKEIAAAVADSHPGLPVEWRFYDGLPAEVIGEATRTASLVVIGSRGRGGFAGLLLGSVSRAVLARAVCPVLVVPAPRG
ncbi:universal stress protein [Brevibacterium sp. R8603A2]|uniref:universal stress protein n=1 Tax=Brevibacterium sp. R8603A2 TaxID=2929779 RepID=UPI001FF76E4E|nr:universal stress protein [Brevibacterium sp. R8603A2]MCK1802983.1 universal stress protein [Brevibacterium sp. R8603A2]